MAYDFPEMYEAYDNFRLEPDREELQRRDDVHLALVEKSEMREALSLILKPGYRLDNGELVTCRVCGQPIIGRHWHVKETA